jgi:hypothetical protein
MKFEWEDIFAQNNTNKLQVGTWRAKVPGGWLVSHTVGSSSNITTNFIFLQDENHVWAVK